MSNWKPEVKTYGSTKWSGNSLVFATKQESDEYVRDLFMRWTQVEAHRSVESDAPVTHMWVDGMLAGIGVKSLLIPPGNPEDPE